jgi:hypothetical protein
VHNISIRIFQRSEKGCFMAKSADKGKKEAKKPKKVVKK